MESLEARIQAARVKARRCEPLLSGNLESLSKPARGVAAACLGLRGPVPVLDWARGLDSALTVEFLTAWGEATLPRLGVPAALPVLQSCSGARLVLLRLVRHCLEQGRRADARLLADAIHPLDKEERSQAELALAGTDEELVAAVKVAGAPPLVAAGHHESEALAAALARLLERGHGPGHPAVRLALESLARLAATRVEKDARSYGVRDAVRSLAAAGALDEAERLASLIYTDVLQLEAALAIRAAGRQVPLPPAPLNDAIRSLLEAPALAEEKAQLLAGDRLSSADRVAALAAEGRFQEAETAMARSGVQELSCRDALAAEYVRQGRRAEAFRLAVRYPHSLCVPAFLDLRAEDLEAALELASGLPPTERQSALGILGPQLGLERWRELLCAIAEEQPRLRMACQCAAGSLRKGRADEAWETLEAALAGPLGADLLTAPERYHLRGGALLAQGRDEEAFQHDWEPLRRDEPYALRGFDGRSLARAGERAVAHVDELLAYAARQPEHWVTLEGTAECLARLVQNKSQEQRAAALFRGGSDPSRQALARFLQGRPENLAAWTPYLRRGKLPCPFILDALFPLLTRAWSAEELIDFKGTGTAWARVRVRLAVHFGTSGQSEAFEKVLAGLGVLEQAEAMVAVLEADPAQGPDLLARLKKLPKRGLDATCKAILERWRAEAELVAGKPAEAWKILSAITESNPHAATQLAIRLGEGAGSKQWSSMLRPLTLMPAYDLADRAPRTLPRWLAAEPALAEQIPALAERMGDPGDQAPVWLAAAAGLGQAGDELRRRGLAHLEENGRLVAQTFPGTLEAALLDPLVGPRDVGRILARTRHLPPGRAQTLLREAFPRLVAAERLEGFEVMLRDRLIEGQLFRSLATLWGMHLVQQPDASARLEEFADWLPEDDSLLVLARELWQMTQS